MYFKVSEPPVAWELHKTVFHLLIMLSDSVEHFHAAKKYPQTSLALEKLVSGGEGRRKSFKLLTSEVVIQHPSQNRADLAKKCPKQTMVASVGWVGDEGAMAEKRSRKLRYKQSKGHFANGLTFERRSHPAASTDRPLARRAGNSLPCSGSCCWSFFDSFPSTRRIRRGRRRDAGEIVISFPSLAMWQRRVTQIFL